MSPAPIPQLLARSAVGRRRGRRVMALVFAAGVGALFVGTVAAPWLSLGLVAGLLVVGCLSVCVLTVVLDERTWRSVQRELDRLQHDRTPMRQSGRR